MFTSLILTTAVILPPAIHQQEEDNDENSKQAMEQLLEREIKTEYQQLLLDAVRLRIRNMQRHIELDEKAARRLTLAAKGAAKKSTEKYVGKVIEYAKQRLPEGDISLNGRILSVSPKEPAEASEQQQPAATDYRLTLAIRLSGVGLNIRHGNGSSGYGLNGGYNTVLNSDLWKDTLSKVTTKAQRSKLEEILAERRRARCVELMTSTFALVLDLDKTQTDQIRAWTDKKIKVVDESDTENGPEWTIPKIGRQLTSEGLQDILDAQQLASFRRQVAAWTR